MNKYKTKTGMININSEKELMGDRNEHGTGRENVFGNWHIGNFCVVLNNSIKMFYFLVMSSHVCYTLLLHNLVVCHINAFAYIGYFIIYIYIHIWKGHPLYPPECIALYEQHSDLCGWPPSEVGSCLRRQEFQCWNHA